MATTKVKFLNSNKTTFFKTLKERVDEYFVEQKISQYANAQMVVKSIVMLSLYFIPYVLIMTQGYSILGMWICTLVMGLGLAGIGMSIMHDANHNAYSSNSFINKLMGNTLTLVGGDIQNWITQHNVLHHTYTNIYGHDMDVDDKGVLRFTPAIKHKPIHRAQLFYVFFFYSITTLYWLTLKDFAQHFQFLSRGTHSLTTFESIKKLLYLLVCKAFLISYIFVLPMMVLDLSFGVVLLGFISYNVVAGLILTIVFQLAHVVEKADFPALDEKGNIENEWAIHQLNTTADFARNNWLITFYVGGLNFQAIHHLFPQICHIHYPQIAPIIEKTAKEFGLEYLYYDSIGKAFNSHVQLLGKLSRDEIKFSNFSNVG